MKEWIYKLLSHTIVGALLFGLWYFLSCLSAKALVAGSIVFLSISLIAALIYTVKQKKFDVLLVLAVISIISFVIGWGMGLDFLGCLGLAQNLETTSGKYWIYPMLGYTVILSIIVMGLCIFFTCDDDDYWWENLLHIIANFAIVICTMWGLHTIFPII